MCVADIDSRVFGLLHHSRSASLRLFGVPLVESVQGCWKFADPMPMLNQCLMYLENFGEIFRTWDDFHRFTLRNGSDCGPRSGDNFGDQQGSKKTRFFGPYGVSVNGGTHKSSILVGFSLINHPAIGVPLFQETTIL